MWRWNMLFWNFNYHLSIEWRCDIMLYLTWFDPVFLIINGYITFLRCFQERWKCFYAISVRSSSCLKLTHRKSSISSKYVQPMLHLNIYVLLKIPFPIESLMKMCRKNVSAVKTGSRNLPLALRSRSVDVLRHAKTHLKSSPKTRYMSMKLTYQKSSIFRKVCNNP